MPIPVNISASRGAKILGISKWGTPLQVWLEMMESREPGFCAKNKYELPVFEGNASTRWGLAFEDAIVKLAESKIGINIIGREQLFTHKKDKFITCHIDGKYIGQKKPLHEGKTTTIYSYNSEWGEPGTDRVPLDVQIQCQHQLICTGAKEVIVSVLVFPKRPDEWEDMGFNFDMSNGNMRYDLNKYNKDGIHMDYSEEINPEDWAETLNQMGYFHTYNIKSDPDLQKIMLAHYRKWWKTHVIGKTPPNDMNIDDIRSHLTEPVGTIICPEEIENWRDEFRLYNEEMNRAKLVKENIKLNVLKFAAESQTAKNNPIDDDSVSKWNLMNEFGEKLFSYDGKTFRLGGK